MQAAAVVAAVVNAGIQTEPTKGRRTRPNLPEIGARHRATLAESCAFPFSYISAPYVCCISEEVQRLVNDEGIACTIVNGNETNTLFLKFKDPTPIGSQSMVTFAVPCNTCEGAEVFFNATHLTVAQVIKRLQSRGLQDVNYTHQMVWSRVSIVMSHTTVNKATIALEIIRNVVAAPSTDIHYAPTVRSTRGYSQEAITAIRQAFEMEKRRRNE